MSQEQDTKEQATKPAAKIAKKKAVKVAKAATAKPEEVAAPKQEATTVAAAPAANLPPPSTAETGVSTAEPVVTPTVVDVSDTSPVTPSTTEDTAETEPDVALAEPKKFLVTVNAKVAIRRYYAQRVGKTITDAKLDSIVAMLERGIAVSIGDGPQRLDLSATLARTHNYGNIPHREAQLSNKEG